MAWTTPRDWVGGELVTEAIMDTHVKGNFDATWHLIVRKTSSESVNSGGTGTTLQNDDQLLMALATNEVWLLQWVIIHSGGATGAPNLKVAFTLPASATMDFAVVYANSGGTFAEQRWQTSGTSKDLLSPASANPGVLNIMGRVSCAGTAGNIQLQWAQNSSSAENETVYLNSCLFGLKLA
jgi:hypothetical protein